MQRNKISHHPLVEELIKFYREHITEDTSIDFKVHKDLSIDLMQKTEDQWNVVATTQGSLELLTELLYGYRAMIESVDNTQDYTWFVLTDIGEMYFTKDWCVYDKSDFAKWMNGIGVVEYCQNILDTEKWKEHMFDYIMGLDVHNDFINDITEAAACDIHRKLERMSFYELCTNMRKCILDDSNLLAMGEDHYRTATGIVEVFSLMCVVYKLQIEREFLRTDMFHHKIYFNKVNFGNIFSIYNS